MFQERLREGLGAVSLALHEPEEFVVRWDRGESAYPLWVWACLVLTAMAGTTTYGMTMGILGGPQQVILKGFVCTLAAGAAWALPLPALYVLNSIAGSRLSASTTLLASLVTVSWGGLAMIASIPFNWFFTTAVPHSSFILFINLLVHAGVGVAMADVFGRVMTRVEPQRGRQPVVWLILVGAIGMELFYSFRLFDFS